jgi:hypothetical protein
MNWRYHLTFFLFLEIVYHYHSETVWSLIRSWIWVCSASWSLCCQAHEQIRGQAVNQAGQRRGPSSLLQVHCYFWPAFARPIVFLSSVLVSSSVIYKFSALIVIATILTYIPCVLGHPTPCCAGFLQVYGRVGSIPYPC